jgi:hypothetical protein
MWIYDGANWLQQPGGKDGADGADGTNGVDGLWTDNGNASISYMDGNVGIGTDDPTQFYKLHIESASGTKAKIVSVDDSDASFEFINSTGPFTVRNASDHSFRIRDAVAQPTSARDRFVINTDGNVGIGMSPTRSTAKEQLAEWKSRFDARLKAEPKADKKAVTLEITDDAFEVMPTEKALAEWMETRGAGDKLQVNGDGFFSNSVNVTGGALKARNNNITLDSDTVAGYLAVGGAEHYSWNATDFRPQTDAQYDLGASNATWKDGFFSGGVYVKGSPLTRTVDLIKTLIALRDATMDETQDIREALRSAIDELVDGLEHEIATMPVPEPEVGTQEISE